MKTAIALIGLILVLLSTNLYLYNRGLMDGKIRYQHSHNMQLTLDCMYKFGLHDGEALGYYEGVVYGKQLCTQELKKHKHTKKKALTK